MVNFTNELNSPDVLAHFQEADTMCIIWERYDVIRFPNYYNCSKMYQCRLPWQCRKIQEVKCLGSVYYAVYQCFLSTKDHLDYHPSIHAENNSKTSHKTRNPRFNRNAYNSCEGRQYPDLSVDETEYLSKLMVAIKKINKKLHWEISNIPSRQKHFSPLTRLIGWGMYINDQNIKKIEQSYKSYKNKITYWNSK